MYLFDFWGWGLGRLGVRSTFPGAPTRIILSTGFGLEIARMEFALGTSGCTYVYGLISLIYTVA